MPGSGWRRCGLLGSVAAVACQAMGFVTAAGDGAAAPDPLPTPVVAAVYDRFAADFGGVSADKLDEWLFGGLTAAAERHFLEALLKIKVDDVDEICRLDDSQKRRLHLACRADIRRLFERFEQLRTTLREVAAGEKPLDAFLRDAQRLRLSVDCELAEDSSFFTTALRNTLSPEQAALYERVEGARRAQRYRGRVQAVVAGIARPLRLNDGQRTRLSDLLQKETQPPRRFSPYDADVVLLQAARLPAELIGSILDGPQQRLWNELGGRIEAVEPFLAEAGLLPESPAGT